MKMCPLAAISALTPGYQETNQPFTAFATLPKKQRLHRPHKGEPDKYANLQPILARPVNWEIIEQQYDEFIKFATALLLGTADAESILRRFTTNNLQHATYKALCELGNR